jgi:hypothetical protein
MTFCGFSEATANGDGSSHWKEKLYCEEDGAKINKKEGKVMDHVELLKKAIVDVVGELRTMKLLEDQNLLEDQIVEKIIQSLLKITKNSNPTNEQGILYPHIGREILYLHRDWGKNKLDLGLGLIEGPKYLFRTAVEVKKWIGKINATKVDVVPQKIWYDIFKITGYQIDENKNVGLRVRVWVILYLLEHACKYFQPEIVLIAEPI